MEKESIMRKPRDARSHLRPVFLVAFLTIAATVDAAEPTLIDQGRAALARGDADAAIAALEKAAAQDPKSAAVQYSLGNAYGAKVQQVGMMGGMAYAPKIRGAYESAVALDPKYVEARFALVQVYVLTPPMMGGSEEKALEQAKAIKAIYPVLGHRAYGVVYAQQRKPDLARKEYLDAIQEQPASAKARSFYGQYLLNAEKDTRGAIEQFEGALKVDSTYMAAFYHLGRTAALGDTNLVRGQTSLEKYVRYTPKENEPPLANANYWLGAVYEKEGKKAEAKQSYEAALKLNPTLKDASEALKRLP